MRRDIKNLHRFNYWDYPAINPLNREWYGDVSLEETTHQNLFPIYESRYKKGDTQAIFDYVKSSWLAFEAPWVAHQITKWRCKNDKQARGKLKKLFTVFLDERGKKVFGKKTNLKELIKRDQNIFKEIVNLRLSGRNLESYPRKKEDDSCFGIVAKKHSTSKETVKKVFQNYKKATQRFFTPPPQSNRRNWDKVFQWLESMLKKL